MQHQILGTTLQTLEMILQPGEMVFSQTHQMAWMTDGITMDTNTGGGVLEGPDALVWRRVAFVTHFSAQSGYACPGRLLPALSRHDHRPAACAGRNPGLPQGNVPVRRSVRAAGHLLSPADRQRDFRRRGVYSAKSYRARLGLFRFVRGSGGKDACSRASACKSMSAMWGCRTPSVQFGITRMKGFRNICSAATACFWRH